MNSKLKALFGALLALCLLCSSCRKEEVTVSVNEQGQVDYLRPLWSSPLHRGDKPYSNSNIRAHLTFDDRVLVGTTHGAGNDVRLTALDVTNGATLWHWDDRYQPATEMMDITHAYEHGGVLAYNVGTRHYAIDLATGATRWKIRRGGSFSQPMSGLGDTYFLEGEPTDTLTEYMTQVAFQGNLASGDIARLLVPPITIHTQPGDWIGKVTSLVSFIAGADTMLLVGWQDAMEDNTHITYLGLYNLRTRTWVYDKMPINERAGNGVLLNPLVLRDGRVYAAVGNHLVCHDLWTGARIWGHTFSCEFWFSGFAVDEGRVVGNCENKVLYAFDAATGTDLWRGEGAGTSSPLEGRHLNGVVYFAGGSSGYLHAVDMRTGRTLWKLNAEKMGDGSSWWRPSVYVVPGKDGAKGRVIALTGMKAYCFEAYR